MPPGPVQEAARDAIELDATVSAFAHVLPVEQLDLLTLYLPGLDVAQARVFATRDRMSPAELAVAVRGVAAVYTSLDDIVARFSTAGVTLVIVGHPGRAVPQQPAWLSVLSASVPADVRAAAVPPALEDVAPTVLALLGVPIADDIAGQPRLDLVAPDFVARHPVRRVETWGTRVTSGRRPADSRIDEDARERLRSLGYVR